MFNYTIAVEVPRNSRGRDFALADLHGCYDALCAAMDDVGFDPAADRIISVGDLVDRGENSLGCLRLLREPWFHAVQGNHENMMLAALQAGVGSTAWQGWMANGGEWFARLDPCELDEANSFLPDIAALPITLTLELANRKRLGVAHAQPPRLNWQSIIDTKALNGDEIWRALWGREYVRRGNVPAVEGVDATVHGHTIVRKPLSRANMHFIDTGTYLHGAVNLWEIDESFLAPRPLL